MTLPAAAGRGSLLPMATKAPVGEVRAWAKQQGFAIGDRGRLPNEVWEAWEAAAAVVPEQRAAADDELATQLAAAVSRVEALEAQVRALSKRLAAVETSREAPRRRFARR